VFVRRRRLIDHSQAVLSIGHAAACLDAAAEPLLLRSAHL
jgi:hypothetical protein